MATSYTTADIATLEAAYLEAVVSGIASVSVGGESVQMMTPEQIEKAISFISGRISSGDPQDFMRAVITKPPMAG